MTHHRAFPGPSRRTPGPLAATMLVVALSALGCGTAGPTERTPEGLPQVPPAGDRGDRGGPFDTSRPEIGNLDPDLLEAIRAAARDAQDDGVRMVVTSGWRSREHQQRLFAEALSKYGSEEEASRWVSTPDTSAHVTGDAVDIGPTDADSWLSQHGSDYGLCQVFANEIWHYELATSPGGRCPEMWPDSSARH
ncbi:M15 family metallopeptidase [Nocardioides sp. YIM 152315]|uniref:M15 family metallopeptidase n=1 Tax=Nocardioides sp. YIM 152315 TaxID=3031760 RepID=UPI0023DBE50B|nr:M15 family metallopeptidase [Nocardioides sp. YIM 152315]MDF1606061.1 M15 family metallopeptidase [Nocardioides sp. YIM 152315]